MFMAANIWSMLLFVGEHPAAATTSCQQLPPVKGFTSTL
jgi:hypothetical protein